MTKNYRTYCAAGVSTVALLCSLGGCGSTIPALAYPSASKRVPLPPLQAATAPGLQAGPGRVADAISSPRAEQAPSRKIDARALNASAPSTVVAPTPPVASSAPTSITQRLLVVNADDRTVLVVLRRWARDQKLGFSSTANVDYPITNRMRRIEASTLDQAIAEMQAALEGVDVPLSMRLSALDLLVEPAQPGRSDAVTQVPIAGGQPTSVAYAMEKTPAVGSHLPQAVIAAPARAGGALPAPTLAVTPAGSGTANFAVLDTDTTLVPVLVRWAQSAGFVPVLNGRRVTTRMLASESFADLALTPEARAVTGSNALQAISAILTTYRRYRVNTQVDAALKGADFVAITTNLPSAAAAPLAPSAPAVVAGMAPVAKQPSEAVSSPTVVPEKTWDAPARKAAGVIAGTWLVGDSASLRAVVEGWAASSGYRVNWNSKQDPAVTDAVRAGQYTGTLPTALMQLAGSFGTFKTPLGMSFKGGVVNVSDM